MGLYGISWDFDGGFMGKTIGKPIGKLVVFHGILIGIYTLVLTVNHFANARVYGPVESSCVFPLEMVIYHSYVNATSG